MLGSLCFLGLTQWVRPPKQEEEDTGLNGNEQVQEFSGGPRRTILGLCSKQVVLSLHQGGLCPGPRLNGDLPWLPFGSSPNE